ncbi:hypothetical protein BJX64DRAFT_266411 [Aspergillus heterothallicus]
MTNKHTEDAPEGVPTSRSPVPHNNGDDTTVTTQAENQQEEEHARKQSQDTPQAEGKETGREKEVEDLDAEDDAKKPESEASTAPPLPDEIPPPLPNEAPPGSGEDDGWEPVWDASAQAYYFYNRFTGVSQWDNPRVPDSSTAPAPALAPAPAAAAAPGTVGEDSSAAERTSPPVLGGYNPAIHGDYDPTAPYAQQYEQQDEGAVTGVGGAVNPGDYGAVGSFNRFTGRWQGESQNPEYHNDENKSRRQMNAYFDVDAAANSHDGRSLRAERSAKKLSKKELKMFKEKRREKKEEKRRAWLRD